MNTFKNKTSEYLFLLVVVLSVSAFTLLAIAQFNYNTYQWRLFYNVSDKKDMGSNGVDISKRFGFKYGVDSTGKYYYIRPSELQKIRALFVR